MGEELETLLQEISLPASGLSLRGSLLTKFARKEGETQAVHNLKEFDEIVLEARREYHGKWLVLFAAGFGVFFLAERSLPVWVCAPLFVLAALIIFSWFGVKAHYLILRRANETIEYRLRGAPAFITDLFEQMTVNMRKENSKTLFVRKNQKSRGER